MSLRHLKTIRRIASLLLLFAVTALFLDLRNWIPAPVITGILSFQLVPAIMRTLAGPGLWLFGIAFIILLTLAFGRVYCSSLCPLGTFQDLVIRFAKHRNRKKWYEYRKPDYGIHYAVLLASGLAVAGGSMFIVDLLEPFSNYGRMVQGLVRPLLVGMNNGVAGGLGWFGAYWLQAIPLPGLTAAFVLIPLAFALFVGWLAYNHGRLFCNLLCPAGALLSLAARFSFVKIAINTATCRDCGLCEMVCKAKCIDSEAKQIDFAACVSCFNCINACPTVGLEFRNPMERRKQPEPVDIGRRQLLRQSILPAAALFTLPAIPAPSDTLTAAQSAPRQLHPITPPGSRGLEHFSSYCTACHLCISSCPTQVLVPSFLEYGATGIFQPRMDYWISSCNYDCTICSTVCPSGAILPIPLEEKKLTQLGKAKFVKEDCIVITKKADCGACSEHCPTKAVKMVPYEKLFLPEVNDEICIGCGACEHPCPTKPRKAIYVEANVVHLEAKKPPKVERPKVEEKAIEEFPF
jgi:ferredoxin